jgi:DNA repair protein RadD
MVGRGFRLSPGKTDCLVLDFAGVIAEHGPVDAIKVKKQQVKGESPTEKAPTKICPECKTYLHPSVNPCPDCGYLWPVKPKHEDRAKEGAILSIHLPPPIRYDVTNVTYSRHVGKSGTPTLKVDYFSGFLRVASEWVCLQHSGYAFERAAKWYHQRTPREFRLPGSIDQLLDWIDGGFEFAVPTAIHVRPPASKDGFPEITRYEFEPQEELA